MEIYKIKIELEALEKAILPPYKGSALRGALGSALKGLVCIRRDGLCGKCTLNGLCAYAFLFEGNPACKKEDKEQAGLGGPQPFVLEPPLEEKEIYEPGEKVISHLVLIGKAGDYFPYIVTAVERMAKKGLGKGKAAFSLVRITDCFAGEIVYERELGELNQPLVPKRWEEIEKEGDRFKGRKDCCLVLETPLRVKRQGELTAALDFEMFIRALLRRVAYLKEYFHFSGKDMNYGELIAKAGNVEKVRQSLVWKDWQRYSNRQGMRMKLGGLVGEIEFAGELDDFWPLLLWGKEMHIGKNTTFGLGKYDII